jgi:hypothetical protein
LRQSVDPLRLLRFFPQRLTLNTDPNSQAIKYFSGAILATIAAT